MITSQLGPGGEFDRIRRIAAALGPVAHGLGDDCAILPAGSGEVVLSADLSVEGVHFRTDWLSFEEIGWRAAAGALSDLAAAGATPVGLLASVGAPRGVDEVRLVELMRGVGAAVASVGGVVLGGDLSASPHWLVDITVVGRAPRPVPRNGARPGDGIWLSGTPGLSRAALVAWRRGAAPESAAREAYAHPVPRIALGMALAEAGARAMIDLSDGLAGDVRHLAAASQVAITLDLERIPIAAAVRQAAGTAEPPAVFAATGGEDYELLAALPPAFSDPEGAELAARCGLPLTRVGVVTAGKGVTLRLDGQPVQLGGYDHFA
ncbi:MAG: thiamine-phosphate kinase [Gemmatimonadetes bacterium]|nr:thiamine-phosphate kinase [Gemmatimonadota bacterium]MBK6778730.1 thiamine-phosphate kinase [Gemmatimonadota bacterium]MBK7924528.1 thiamine-phosphate kinase [Gemmatimonadota bacterium]MBK9693636.1 thiamine-phosphate kinase [Gemmatimonadota bacterium]